jgi:hypothetical protein
VVYALPRGEEGRWQEKQMNMMTVAQATEKSKQKKQNIE